MDWVVGEGGDRNNEKMEAMTVVKSGRVPLYDFGDKKGKFSFFPNLNYFSIENLALNIEFRFGSYFSIKFVIYYG